MKKALFHTFLLHFRHLFIFIFAHFLVHNIHTRNPGSLAVFCPAGGQLGVHAVAGHPGQQLGLHQDTQDQGVCSGQGV